MFHFYIFVAGLVGLWACSDAYSAATDFAFSSLPSRFQTRELSVGSRALGEICLSRDSMPDGSVCNPAFLPEYSDSELLGRVFFGNGYNALSTANNLIFQPVSKEFLEDLFQNQNATSLEAHAGLLFVAKHFSASFSPYRVQYSSEVHNPNFAVVALHAAVEQSFTVSGGAVLLKDLPAESELSAGIQLRALKRDFVHGSFSFFQAMVEEPRSLLPAKQQRAVYLDPYLGWRSPGSTWKPRLGLSVKNLGWVWPVDPLYPEYKDLSVGFGLEPEVGFGRLKLGVEAVDLFHGGPQGRFRSGLSYQFGILEAMLGANESAATVGVNYGFQVFQAGVVYEFDRADFAGGAGSRIATELSIKL